MNDSGGSALTPGSISARIDRLPATRTIWTSWWCSASACSSSSTTSCPAYVAPGLVKSGVLTARPRACSARRGGELHRRFVHRPVHRHDRVRLPRRPLRAPRDLHLVAALVLGRQRHGGAADRRLRPEPLAVRLRRRPRRRMVTIGTYISELVPKGMRGRAFAVNQAIGFTCVPIVAFLAFLLVPRRRSGSTAGAGWC